MAEGPRNRPLREYSTPSQLEPHKSIVNPAINRKDFELKPSLISAIQQRQFSGVPTDDPNEHLTKFIQFADTVIANGVTADAIRLRLFPFSLRDRAWAWLQSLPQNSVTTWEELKTVFLACYFPPSKTVALRAQINGFRQKDTESLFDAWERYKDMMRMCPHHGLEDWLVIHTFYNGLLYNTRLSIDAAAGGTLMDKPYDEAYQLIENMAQNHYQWGSERTPVEKSQTKGGILTLPPAATVAAITPNCELCGVLGHAAPECAILAGVSVDQVNYAQGNPYSNTYNPGWKNHPNFSYKNNNALFVPNQAPVVPPGYQKPAANIPNMPNVPRKSNLEIMMENFIATQAQQNKDFLNQNVHTGEQLKQLATKVDALATHNKMLETQIAQVAQQQATTSAPAGSFPGQPQPNPKGHANAITLRSGTELDGPIDPRLQNPTMYQKPDKATEKPREQPETEKEDENEEASEKEKPYVPPPPYKPPIPYPQRLAKSKNEGQFKKFVELLKQLNVTIPFTEAITQMPSYAKFLKEILSNKKKIVENETVTLTAEYKALCDLGASVSLMPLSICEKLKLGELRPTRMSLQLADRSVKFPVGMLENVPVRIGQFYIPTDFIIMDIKEDSNIPIILGRPFLATAGAIIDVKKGKLTFEVGEEKVEFILSQFFKAPAIDDSCCFLDVIDECVKEMEKQQNTYSEVLKIQMPPIFEDDNWREEYQDNNLSECLALTPDHIPCPKKPAIELKTLPKDLRYEFLDEELERPVIVNADLGQIETEKLLNVLRKYPTALGYNISDLKGISPSICMHRIMLEEECKTSQEHQRRINLILSDVVKKEVQKLLEAGIIYPISDSK
ncbi:uncharacterized protein LOC131657848 [Vicia villosa]|uniref:uncharacterized protein LOC131657848 n=1 Tax=Vicia villosa TaxID=3911 RepID=UPI00273AFC49|nr:uncharacterized protein LOC131657848 [Vicia villosa]